MWNLRAAGGSFNFQKREACVHSKPCYNRVRLEAPSADCQAKNSVTPDRQNTWGAGFGMKPTEPKPYLKIGDVARLVGVSPSVIRSWESLGLTRPHRTISKYRLYTPEDIKLLKRARFLRKVRGLNAPAIAQLLKHEGLAHSPANGVSSAIAVHLRQ